jgi:hypothetical protein
MYGNKILFIFHIVKLNKKETLVFQRVFNDKAFSPSYDWLLPQHLPSLKAWPVTHKKTVKERQLAGGREGGGVGGAKLYDDKSLVLYKSFNTLDWKTK